MNFRIKNAGKWPIFAIFLFFLSGCAVRNPHWEPIEIPADQPARSYLLEVTGYCACGPCCGWERDWLGRPVISGGLHEGERKKVGYTASGTRAHPGTIAADTNRFPFGTILYVPGYGYGRVEDCGREIIGYKIDLYFPHHSQAEQWGRVKKRVLVWPPQAGRTAFAQRKRPGGNARGVP